MAYREKLKDGDVRHGLGVGPMQYFKVNILFTRGQATFGFEKNLGKENSRMRVSNIVCSLLRLY